MICKKCGTDNGELKKTCSNCGAFLEGRAINNGTAKWGYRTPEEFTKEGKRDGG